jgi:hypothetical protein
VRAIDLRRTIFSFSLGKVILLACHVLRYFRSPILLLTGPNALGGDNEIARATRHRLRDSLNTIMPVLRNERFDPPLIIAIENQVFRTSDDEAVDVADFRSS